MEHHKTTVEDIKAGVIASKAFIQQSMKTSPPASHWKYEATIRA